jgi:hypothetical protein
MVRDTLRYVSRDAAAATCRLRKHSCVCRVSSTEIPTPVGFVRGCNIDQPLVRKEIEFSWCDVIILRYAITPCSLVAWCPALERVAADACRTHFCRLSLTQGQHLPASVIKSSMVFLSYRFLPSLLQFLIHQP